MPVDSTLVLLSSFSMYFCLITFLLQVIYFFIEELWEKINNQKATVVGLKTKASAWYLILLTQDHVKYRL